MSDVAPAAAPRVPRAFALGLATLTLLLLVLGILRSNRGTLRGDEVVTLFWNRENADLASMAKLGARGQVSPAPLFYMLDLLVDQQAERVDYFGLTPSGYYRLPSLLYTATLGAAAAWLLARRLARQERPASSASYVLVLCGLAVYWFQPKMFSFACIDRPYALWNGLWLLSLALLLARPDLKVALAVVLSLMATTATAACFQIAAIGIGWYAGRRLQGKHVREIVREAAPVLAIPALLGIFYALRSQPVPQEDLIRFAEAVPDVIRFWLVTNLPAWLAAGFCVVLLCLRPKLRDFAVPVGALVALLILVPLIYTLATSRGYSSPSRQYLWTTTALPFALFVAALGLSEFSFGAAAPRCAALAGLALALGFSTVTFFRPPARNDSRRLACLDRGSPLEELLTHERPGSLSFPREIQEIDRLNIKLLRDWIRTRYRDLPHGNQVAPLRVVDGELRSEPVMDLNHFSKHFAKDHALLTGY